MKPLSRRTLLRGAGTIAIALPWLEAMEARAQTPPKKRFVVMFSPCGIVPDTWYPTGTGAAFTLNSSMAPLEPHKSKLLLFENVHNKAALSGPGNAHARGVALMLTGSALAPEPLFGDAGWAQGISVDQAIAKAVGASTRFKSIELGVQVNQNTNVGRISYAGPNLPLEPQNSPKAAFDRIFSGVTGGGPDPAAEALRLQRKSILDSVKGDFTAVNASLGVEDQRRLEAHLASIREMERELIEKLPTTEGCGPPPDPQSTDPALTAGFMTPANFPKVGALQTRLLVKALECDLTRVASLMWSRGVSPVVHTWAGVTGENHHQLSHLINDTEDARQKLTKISVWYAQQFASLLQQMDQVKEGQDGKSLLDNSAVLWGNELSNGDTHSRNNIPFVLAGSCGGYFRTGRYMRYGSTFHNNLLVSCMNAMGLPATTFGKPEFCTGPLTGLT